nr:MAG TPA: hypothetical protein [Caudoviricetes sp.]
MKAFIGLLVISGISLVIYTMLYAVLYYIFHLDLLLSTMIPTCLTGVLTYSWGYTSNDKRE